MEVQLSDILVTLGEYAVRCAVAERRIAALEQQVICGDASIKSLGEELAALKAGRPSSRVSE